MTDNQAAMQDTMNEIFGAGVSMGTRKDDLLAEIATLEKDINSAQETVNQTNEEWSSFSQTLSPEQSNESRRKIVFLKKDLENKKLEYDELNEV